MEKHVSFDASLAAGFIRDDEITSIAELRYNLYKHNVGDTIKVTYQRNDKEDTVKVTLTASED